MARGGISKAQMQELLNHLHSLSDGGSIPVSLLPDTVATLESGCHEAVKDHLVGPKQIKARICGQCGTAWGRTQECVNRLCTRNKKQKPKTSTCTKWNLAEQLRAFVQIPELASHVLDHTLPGLRSSSILNSKRYRFMREAMDRIGAELDPRHMVLILHWDGFTTKLENRWDIVPVRRRVCI